MNAESYLPFDIMAQIIPTLKYKSPGVRNELLSASTRTPGLQLNYPALQLNYPVLKLNYPALQRGDKANKLFRGFSPIPPEQET